MHKILSWNGVTCYASLHYMKLYTIGPGHWTINVGTDDSNVLLHIQLPSWNTIYGVGSWSQGGGCTVYITYVNGGNTFSYVTWNGEVFWPCFSGYAVLSGFSSHGWSSGYGNSYPVMFTLTNNRPGGESASQTLYMTS